MSFWLKMKKEFYKWTQQPAQYDLGDTPCSSGPKNTELMTKEEIKKGQSTRTDADRESKHRSSLRDEQESKLKIFKDRKKI